MSDHTSSTSSSSSSSTIIREVWIEKEMQKRAREFTENKKLTIHIGSWNVNAKKPSEDLEEWLIQDGHDQADIYALGFQEIVDLNAGNLLVDHNASKPWESKIENTLKQQYSLICTKHLVGLSLCVYIKRALLPEVSLIASESVGVGIMGVGGNKGAVGIRFNLYNSSICFINCHLAAHQHNSAGRNSDYQNICARLQFQDAKASSAGMKSPVSGNGTLKSQAAGGGGASSTSSSSSSSSSSSHSSANTLVGKSTLFEHDHLFWLGDLNYRISTLDINEVYRRIEASDWSSLLLHDQLLSEKGKGNAFKYFKEGQIDFAPTYKYQPGTSLYERREDKKKRIPAWCDRIQWIGEDIQQLYYQRCENLKISDHKPVYARFEVGAKEVIQEKKRTVYESLIRQLDSWENQAIPKVEITPTSVDFGLTKFEELITRKLTIANTGTVTVVEFHFVPKVNAGVDSAATAGTKSAGATFPSINQSGKKWLKIFPEFGIIPPGESVDITLQVHVTNETSHTIQTGVETLEDILILTLENGRDYFIPVQGDYEKSCFGTTVEYLVNTPTPVRTSLPTKEPTSVLSLPKEIWRMVDYIYRNGIQEDRLFVTSGEKEEIDRIRENLDTGTEFGSYSIHSMAESLIYFLKSLSEPVFPPSLIESYHDGGTNLTNFCKHTLLLLPPAHYNTFIYLISFLRECLKHTASNHLTPNQLVLVFASCLMHCELDGMEQLMVEDSITTPTNAASSANASTTQPASSPTHSSAAGGHGKDTPKKPKAWIILRHYLTSEEFV